MGSVTALIDWPAGVAYAILALLLIIQVYYMLFVYSKFAWLRPVERPVLEFPPLSVIISAYNEEKNLKAYLPQILEQDYPEFEVVVVDDCSEDDSKWVLNDLKNRYPHLRVVEIQEHVRLKHKKKFTLTMGIKAARHEHLVFTDADCVPGSAYWLKGMAAVFGDGKEIVLGYSPYFRTKGFLNKLIRFETAHTALSYLSYALKGDAYMGVGRNLAYTKELFYRGKGFTSHMHIKSGDDDLFVNQNSTAHNVGLAIHPNEHMYSNPKATWKSYYKQKARHSGASVLYKRRHQYKLAIQLITAVLFYVMLVVCVLVDPKLWFLAVSAYLIRLGIQYVVYVRSFRKLGVADLLPYLPILDIVFYFYICFNGLFNRTNKHLSWK